MKSLSDFLNMGGYGLYVWGSYVVTLIVMVGEIVLLRQRERTLTQTLGRRSRG
jgi:heme exporter protein D